MHAIALGLADAATAGCAVLYLSAEQFMYRFVRALREKDTIDFKADVPLGRCADGR